MLGAGRQRVQPVAALLYEADRLADRGQCQADLSVDFWRKCPTTMRISDDDVEPQADNQNVQRGGPVGF